MKKVTLLKLTLLTISLIASRAWADTQIWTGLGGNQNWSTGGNWTNATAATSGTAPGSADDVRFMLFGAAADTNTVNNIVDASLSVATLQFGNTNIATTPTNAHTTQIAAGQTLSVTGAGTNCVVGSLTDTTNAFVYNKVTGAGTLNVNNAAATIYVSQGRAVNNNGAQRATLDLTGLDNFTVTAGRIGVGTRNGGGANNVQNSTGTLLLARTNLISLSLGAGTASTNLATAASAIDVGEADGNAGGVNFLFLGQSNAIFADSICVGKTKSFASLLFHPTFSNPTAYIRGTNGVNSRVTFWSIGDMQSSGSSSSQANGTNDFSGGTLDAMVGTLSLGRDRSGGNTGAGITRGTLTFTAGTLDVNTLLLGNQAFTTAGNSNPMNGVLNVNGANATLVVNNNLVLGNTTAASVAAARTSGILNVTNGAVRVNAITTGATSTNNIVTLNGATLTLTNAAGTPAKGITSFTAVNTTLQLNAGNFTNIVVTNLVSGGATNVIQILAAAVQPAYPATIRLIKYAGSIGGAGYNFGFGNTALPASAPNAYLTNDTAIGSIDLIIPNDPRPVIAANPASYAGSPGDNVNFTVAVHPASVTPLSYQWQRFGTNLSNGPTGNGSTISGTTTDTLTITSAQSGDNGDYTVAISNAYGATTSAPPAVLTISAGNVPPNISGPNNITVIQGNNATFTASVAGAPTPDVQWQKNGVEIPGATTASLTITNAQYPADQATYSIVATNVAGALTNSATLTVIVPPVITDQPTNLTVNNGSPAAFTVIATGVPAPGYQWKKNGVELLGETSATLSFASAAPSDAAVYSVLVTNVAGTVLSSAATLVVTSTTLTIASLAPTNNAPDICVDTLLRLTFSGPPTLGAAGRIRIYNITNTLTPVDTIDLGANAGNGSQLRTIAGNNLNTFPVIISGNTATIHPHLGVLTTNQTYFVTVENTLNGVFKDATGATFAGINDSTTWRFTTKAVNPASGATTLTVAADGSGDFCTVQGVLDFLPVNNTTARTINLRNGVYREIVRNVSRHNLTFRGESQLGTIITYANNELLNSGTAGRPMFRVQANDITFDTLTLTNSTPKGGSQAEALRIDGQRQLYTNVFFASFQDTLLINNSGDSAYIVNSLIQGDTDFIWGLGTPYFQNVEVRALNAGHNTQMRTDSAHYGAVFADCSLTKPAGSNFVTHTLGRGIGSESDFGNSVYLNCKMDTHIVPSGWVSGSANLATIRYWEYQSVQLDGVTPVDVSSRAAFSVQISAATNLLMRNLTNVLGGWLPTPALHVDSQPVGQTAYAGANVSFSVAAGGIFAPGYQWQKDGTNIAGATSSTLLLNGVSAADAGNYSCVVSNVNAVLSSSAAPLTVITPVPPALSDLVVLGDGNFQFNATGASGQAYRVWASSNVALTPITSTWTLLNSGTFGGSPVTFTDTQATNYPQRFYLLTVP